MADVQVILVSAQRENDVSDFGDADIGEGGKRAPDGGHGGADDDESDDAPSGGDDPYQPVADDVIRHETDENGAARNRDVVAVEEEDGGVGIEPTNRRRRHRRGKSKKRKWKPYNKLTWEEKRELEDREARRANRIRAERFAHGQPVAPYNTTQFLMEDHNVQEPDLENHRQHRESTGTLDSDEYYSSPEDEEEFLQKEFCVEYDSIHAERLSSMTKLELIQEYMQLEDRVEKLEQKLKGCGRDRTNDGDPKSVENLEKIRIFQQEMLKLAEENERLRRENYLLREVRCTDGDEPVEPMDNSGDVDEEMNKMCK